MNKAKNKIPSITNLATVTALNAKINEIKHKTSDTTNLAATTALAAVENKILSGSNLVKKIDCNTKMSEIENKITTDHDHDEYITTQEFNKLTLETFTARLAQAKLASQSDLANVVKKTDFNDKLKNLNKNLLQIKQNMCLMKMNQMSYQKKLEQY